MRKCPTKTKILGIIFVGILIACLSAAGTILLLVKKQSINDHLSSQLESRVSIDSLFYIFPNIVILKNISFEQQESGLPGAMIRLPVMRVDFSLAKLIQEKELRVSKIEFSSFGIEYATFHEFLKGGFQDILRIILDSPRSDIEVRMNGVRLYFGPKKNSKYLRVDFAWKSKKETVTSSGLFQMSPAPVFKEQENVRETSQDLLLGYKMKGHLAPEGLAIDQLIVKNKNFYSKLWGDIHGSLLKVNGFTFVGVASQDNNRENFSLSQYVKSFPDETKMDNIGFYILDIDGEIQLSLSKANIKKIDFSLNNIPTTMTGNISFGDALAFDTAVSFQDPYLAQKSRGAIEQTDLQLTGQLTNRVLGMDGVLDIKFWEKEEESFSPQKVSIDFTDIHFQLGQKENLMLGLEAGDFSYWINDNEHKVSIDGLSATLGGGEGHHWANINALFSGGTLDADLKVDTNQSPMKVESHLTLEDVDTSVLEELLINFAKFNGRMSSVMDFTNVPQLQLRGTVSVFDGTVTNLDFFDWVADTFRLLPLKAVDFERGSAAFSIDRRQMKLYDIHFKTDDVWVGGYFDVDHESLVSSKITMRLSKNLLTQSPDLKPVLKDFKDVDTHLGFDFQLSGSLDATNFQWLPSAVKTKIQEHIPDFVERMIERNVDAIME